MTTTVRAAGMSLRDWFAGQALSASGVERDFDLEVTRVAYRIADAMMERRK